MTIDAILIPLSLHHFAAATVSLVSPDFDPIITSESLFNCVFPATTSSAACSTYTGIFVFCFAIAAKCNIIAIVPPTATKKILLYPSAVISFAYSYPLLIAAICFVRFPLYSTSSNLIIIDYLPEFLNNNWYIGYSFEQAKYIMFTPNCQYIKNTIHPQNAVYTIPI